MLRQGLAGGGSDDRDGVLDPGPLVKKAVDGAASGDVAEAVALLIGQVAPQGDGQADAVH